MKAKLKFDNYRVLKIDYRNGIRSVEDNDEIAPQIGVKIGISENDNKKALVRLSVKIGELEDSDSEDDNLGKEEYVHVEVVGFFHFESDEDEDEDELFGYYQMNGTAILFPYLRSLVSDVTGKGNQSPIILPAIDVFEFFNNQD